MSDPAPQRPPEAPATRTPLFVFRLGERWFALPPERVDTVTHDDHARTLVPMAPSYLQGVVNYRGQALAVVDPSGFLELAERPPTRRLLVVRVGELQAALPSPEVRGVVLCDESALQPPEQSMRYTRGVLDLEVGVTQVLDLGALLGTAAELGAR